MSPGERRLASGRRAPGPRRRVRYATRNSSPASRGEYRRIASVSRGPHSDATPTHAVHRPLRRSRARSPSSIFVRRWPRSCAIERGRGHCHAHHGSSTIEPRAPRRPRPQRHHDRDRGHVVTRQRAREVVQKRSSCAVQRIALGSATSVRSDRSAGPRRHERPVDDRGDVDRHGGGPNAISATVTVWALRAERRARPTTPVNGPNQTPAIASGCASTLIGSRVRSNPSGGLDQRARRVHQLPFRATRSVPGSRARPWTLSSRSRRLAFRETPDDTYAWPSRPGLRHSRTLRGTFVQDRHHPGESDDVRARRTRDGSPGADRTHARTVVRRRRRAADLRTRARRPFDLSRTSRTRTDVACRPSSSFGRPWVAAQLGRSGRCSRFRLRDPARARARDPAHLGRSRAFRPDSLVAQGVAQHDGRNSSNGS